MAALKDKVLSLLDRGDIPEEFIYNSFLPGYHKDSISKSINHLREEGLVEANDLFRLTGEGAKKLKQKYPYYRYQHQPWDGLWRIVIFDIPEINRAYRDSLRKELKSRGFGLWQTSVWISPYDQDFQKELSILPAQVTDNFEIFKGLRLTKGDERSKAQEIWDLTGLGGAYEKVYQTWQNRLSEQKAVEVKKIRLTAATLQDSYLTLLLHDPGLPQELLPVDWFRDTLEATSWQWRSFLSL